MERCQRSLLGVVVAALQVVVLGIALVLSPGWAAGEVASSRKDLAPWQRCLRASGTNKALVLQGRDPDWERNIVFCKEAVRLESDTPKVSLSLGALARAYAGKGDLDVAISLYKDALGLMQDVDLHLSLAEVYRRKGQLAEAITSYKKAIRLRSDNAQALFYLGKAYGEKGQWDAAIISFKEAVRLRPDSADTHSRLGLAYMKKSRLDDAIASFKEAIRLQPDLAEAHYHLGVAYKEKGWFEAAITSYKKAAWLKPDSVATHYSLGWAYRKKGQLDKAIGSYKEALHLQPDLPEAHYNLGVVYALNERRALADHHLYEAATLYLKRGNRDGALEAYGYLRDLKSTLADGVFEKLYP